MEELDDLRNDEIEIDLEDRSEGDDDDDDEENINDMFEGLTGKRGTVTCMKHTFKYKVKAYFFILYNSNNYLTVKTIFSSAM